MNVARFNFSHGSHAEHEQRLDALKALRTELNLPVAAMLDTKGPEVRLRTFETGSVELRAGQDFTLTLPGCHGEFTNLLDHLRRSSGDVKAGNAILLDDAVSSV